ncbi:MAG TPA: GNAT family N-acetyltransferase [Terriglobales bacterium]|nr:GNAT family N-acetyltransferase [Terriglobales bacterium]
MPQDDRLVLDRQGKHRLDELDAKRVARHLVMFEPSPRVLANLIATARLSIPGLAPTSEALKVQHHNPICVMALARRSKFDQTDPVGEGFIAILPLTSLGLQMFALGSFDATCPDLRLIAKPDERPAGIYMWGVYGPGPLAAGMALFMEKMASPQYAGIDLYSRPNTDVGVRFNQVLGFKQGTWIGDVEAPNVWKFARTAVTPAYDNYVPRSGEKEIGITVARTFDDLMRVAAVRNAVYIGEQECPYDEEYDGNDLSATHLLAYIGDEPVGCLRLRFFADFAKFERVAIRKEFRKSRAAIKLVQAGLKFCQKKGYRRVIGHAQTRLASFWTRFGFRPMEGREHFVFSDYDYVEMVAELEIDPNAVVLGADPYLMIRPEGRWHVPGILESSAARAATSPSVAKKR